MLRAYVVVVAIIINLLVLLFFRWVSRLGSIGPVVGLLDTLYNYLVG